METYDTRDARVFSSVCSIINDKKYDLLNSDYLYLDEDKSTEEELVIFNIENGDPIFICIINVITKFIDFGDEVNKFTDTEFEYLMLRLK